MNYFVLDMAKVNLWTYLLISEFNPMKMFFDYNFKKVIRQIYFGSSWNEI